ncbi:MAG: hypothetical protein AB7R89_28690 [Dehalococcoidia bacterium]
MTDEDALLDRRMARAAVQHRTALIWLQQHDYPVTWDGVRVALDTLDQHEPGVSGREGDDADIYLALETLLWAAQGPIQPEQIAPPPAD